MKNKAIISGSFDPITFGHLDIIHRASLMFDELYVAVCVNETKKTLFTIPQRIDQISKCTNNIPNVKIVSVDGLLSRYAQSEGIKYIVRGVRNSNDFQYEDTLFLVNKDLGDIETVFLFSNPILRHVSSSMVKTIVSNYGAVDKYVPLLIKSKLEQAIHNKTILCIVGVSGSGKSHLARSISDFMPRSVKHINLDDVANQIYERNDSVGLQVKGALVNNFGYNVCVEGVVNRKALADIVFSDIDALMLLNEIMAEPIKQQITHLIESTTERFVIFDGALIPEHGLLHVFNNNVILTYCDDEQSISRIINRDSISPSHALARSKSQLTTDQKRSVIQHAIRDSNYGTLLEVDTTNGISNETLVYLADKISQL